MRVIVRKGHPHPVRSCGSPIAGLVLIDPDEIKTFLLRQVEGMEHSGVL